MQKSSVNKVILVGHLGSKPEGRYTPSGSSTCTFSVATNESWLDQEKQKQEHTEWHNIIAWNKLAEFASDYLQKGQLIYIEGKLHTRTYKDKDEVQHWKTEIIANSITPLEWKTDGKRDSESKTEDTIQESNKDEDLPF